MKKLSLYIFLVLMFCNIVQALPECEGNDTKGELKKFTKVRKWTNCHGSFTYKGAKYVGEFYKGKFHGQGTFTAAGRKYVGQWKNHYQHGQGTYTYANGDKYVGEWKRGLRHGKGIFTHANGKVEEGTFKNNKFVKEQ